MNGRESKRNTAPRLGLIGFTIALLIAMGCSSSDSGNTLSNLAGDLARQLVTWWIL